jgi:undecaprenyl diphosphate synthase
MTLPEHIGIIMDGNRRWAKERGLPSLKGHREGVKTLKRILNLCEQYKIKILTVFAFSTENWNRPAAEVNYLMNLFLDIFSKKDVQRMKEKNIKVNVLGQKHRFSKAIQERIEKAEKETSANKDFILNIALSYGGRADIVEAVKKILKKGITKIDEDLISKNLWTKGLRDPDLIIRTGKEQRFSNFLIWQSAYSELYFSDKSWPAFDEKEFKNILKNYAERQRRFGR